MLPQEYRAGAPAPKVGWVRPSHPAIDAVVSEWPGGNFGVAVVRPTGVVATWGDPDRPFELASVTKPLAASAVWLAVEEKTVMLDDPIHDDRLDPSVTLRHLLSHASGLGFESDDAIGAPGMRRIYSNAGFDLVAQLMEVASGFTMAEYLAAGVFEPLAMTSTTLWGRAAHEARGTARDLGRWAAELLAPALFHPDTRDAATSVQFPELDGVLPGFGLQKPNPWGLGVEIAAQKTPHWTAPGNSPATFGHFGRSGGFLWIDPAAELGLVGLGDVDFGPWARSLWPRLGAAVLDAGLVGAF